VFVLPTSLYVRAKRLLAAGASPSAVAVELGLSRETVRLWATRGSPGHEAAIELARGWSPPDRLSYCYVLGLYLGDGHIAVHRGGRSGALRLSLDAIYPGIVAEAKTALETTFVGGHVSQYTHGSPNCVLLQISHPAVLKALPHHGPGKKHARRIELASWQAEITRAHPEAFIRGLIHSDGCRTVNRFKTKLPSGRVAEYEYPRYFFSNLSADIRQIFIEHCELLGIRCTTGHHRNVSVSHRKSVALLEEIVGPKS
jgi:hypothetical protein